MDNLVIPDTLHRESLVFDLLDNTNYASWRKNMRILFMRMSLLDLVDHSRPPDATPAWETANKWAFSEIYFRCRPDIQASLSDTMTARQAWTSLEDVFQSSSTANIFQLTLAFNTLHQRVGQPVLTFINDVVAAATDLRYLGEDVSDQKIKWQILANLLPEYASLVTTLTNLDRDDDPLDIRDIKESCMREERIMNRRAAVLLLQQPPAPAVAAQPAPVAYVASSSATGAASSTSGTRRCEECGLSSHAVQTCWVRHPELRPSLYRSRDDRRNRSRERDRREPRGRDRRDNRHRDNSRGNSRERHDRHRSNSRARHDRRRGNSRDRDRRRREQSHGRMSSRNRERRRARSTEKHRTSDKENRASKDRHKRKFKPPAKQDSSSSESSSSSEGTPSPNTHHAKAVQGIPVGKNVPNVVNHACMVRSSASSGSGPGSRWLLDSGASNHYTSNVHLLTDVHAIPPTPVETANKVIHATAKGTLILRLTCGMICITDVMYVPDLLPNTHLISIGQLESKGLEFHMRNRKCYMFKLGALWAVAPRENFVYYLQECSPEQLAMHMNSFPPIISPSSAKIILSSYNAKRRTDTQLLTTWHRRLGHINKKYLSLVPKLVDGVAIGEPKKYKLDCDDCVKASQRRQISRMPGSTPTENLEIIHADLCGPMQLEDFWGHKYTCLLVCAKSRFKWLHLLKKKDEAAQIVIGWKSHVERQFGCKVKRLQTDGGGEWHGPVLQQWLATEGIEHVTTQPYSSEMNGLAEVYHRVLIHSASAMLNGANLRLDFWGQAALCAVYLNNRTPTKARGLNLKMTPYEALHGVKPYLGHVRIWGCRVYAHVPDKKRKKLDPHSKECMLMGYFDTENMFRLFDIHGNAVIKCRDAIFFEDVLGHEKYTKGGLAVGKDILGGTLGDADLSGDEDDVSDIALDDDHEHEVAQKLHALVIRNLCAEAASSPTTDELIALGRDSITPSLKFSFAVPRTYTAAMKSLQADHWAQACNEEYQSLLANGTWTLVDPPPGALIIRNKWVFAVKTTDVTLQPGEVPTIRRFKARLVARGDSQTKGINFDETYAPVVRFISLRIILHLASVHNWEIDQGDFVSAFLNGTLRDYTIYMAQPEGYDDSTGRVCLMRKSIYGLKQSARAWWEDLNHTLSAINLRQTTADQALWIRQLHFLLSHVDDVLIVGNRTEVDSTKDHLNCHYKFKDLGPVSKYIGMVITRDRPNRRLCIDQAPYVHDILDEFQMSNCSPVSIPMDPKDKWDPSDGALSGDVLSPAETKVYQRAIGRLMYLMVGTRPDIAYAVTKLAQFSARPSLHHWSGIIRILRYLRSHDSVRLTLGKCTLPVHPSTPVPTSLVGYFDASLMDCASSRKSTGAYVFFLNGSLISWCSKRQGLVALSSTEAEFIAGTEAARELMWILGFLDSIGIPEKSPILFGDNKGALALARHHVYRPRTKHIHVRERYITHMVESGQCLIEYVSTRDMIADALTKPLPREPLERHARLMGLVFQDSSHHQCGLCYGIFPTRNQLHAHIKQTNHYVDEVFPVPKLFC